MLNLKCLFWNNLNINISQCCWRPVLLRFFDCIDHAGVGLLPFVLDLVMFWINILECLSISPNQSLLFHIKCVSCVLCIFSANFLRKQFAHFTAEYVWSLPCVCQFCQMRNFVYIFCREPSLNQWVMRFVCEITESNSLYLCSLLEDWSARAEMVSCWSCIQHLDCCSYYLRNPSLLLTCCSCDHQSLLNHWYHGSVLCPVVNVCPVLVIGKPDNGC